MDKDTVAPATLQYAITSCLVRVRLLLTIRKARAIDRIARGGYSAPQPWIAILSRLMAVTSQ